MSAPSQSYSQKNSWLFFSAITTLSALLIFASQYLLISDDLYYDALVNQLTVAQVEDFIDKSHQLTWLPYVLLPAINLVKFSALATCLSLGYYMLTNRWLFIPFFRIAIQAELVLLLPNVVKLLWFLLIQPDYNLTDLQYFYPLSLLNLLDPTDVSTWLLYPLQLINLFEVAYWIVLAYTVSRLVGWSVNRGLGMVAASYGTGLLLWVVFIMFLSISLS
ncbi:hypothetical protein [Spirosoma soli]